MIMINDMMQIDVRRFCGRFGHPPLSANCNSEVSSLNIVSFVQEKCVSSAGRSFCLKFGLDTIVIDI